MLKNIIIGLSGALLLALAACGGGSSASSPSVAKPSAPTSAAAKPAAPSASVVGQKAPGPFSANGTVTVDAAGAAALEATDTLKWQPDVLVAKPGTKVTLTVKNGGASAHTFLSPALGITSPVEVNNGQTVTASFTTPTQPGAYQFWCNIPGHAEAGMVGEVIVQ